MQYIVDAARNATETRCWPRCCWPRLITHVIGRRLTFGDAFAYAAEALTGDAVIVANADIFLEDATLARLGPTSSTPERDGVALHGHVFALTRWDWQCKLSPARPPSDPPSPPMPFADSADSADSFTSNLTTMLRTIDDP